ncbi:hypothetical protein V6N13_025796 [Hibiscus sabdariffa]
MSRWLVDPSVNRSMNSVMERSNGNWNQRNLGNSDMEHSHQRFVGSFQSRLDRAVADFSPLYGPIQSVGPTGSALKSWSLSMRKEKRAVKDSLEARLKELEEGDLNDDVLADLIDVKLGLNIEANKEELSWEQRARVNWLSHGDKNTTFFHNFAAGRKKNNLIKEIGNGQGSIVSTTEEIACVAVDFFKDLFSASVTSDAETVLRNVRHCVTPIMNEVLSAPFQSEEVWIAVKSMSPLRAPDKGDGRIRDHTIDIRYTRVADLINPTSNEWNSALVKSIFTPSMAQQILCIPLAKTETDDMLVWRFEGNGHYTPKSGYRLLREEASMEFRAKACESAVLFAIELGFKFVQVEGDSLTVIRKLSSDSLDKSIIQPIIIDIKAKLQLFEKITFSHVGRQGNAAAHALAKIHTQFQLPRYWVKEAPQEVEQVTIADLR